MEYEEACERRIEENEHYLDLFESFLAEKGLSKKTIQNHMQNTEFYINSYLLRYEPEPIKEGCYMIAGFLGDYFIRKCMWSTPGNIKSTAASIKKFYSCMFDNEIIDKNDYETLCESIKENIEEWQETCRQYDDPDDENPFAFF